VVAKREASRAVRAVAGENGMDEAVPPKPDHLGPEYGAQFSDPAVVAAYRHRPPYPAGVFEVLAGLVVEPRAVLDAGCGTGAIARGLVGRVDRVDAVDPSAAMLATGRALPGGDHPALRWILGAAEGASLGPPYGLVVTASSLHWMEWSVVLPRFQRCLASGGVLAIVGERVLPTPWDKALAPVIARHSTNRRYRPYDLIEELETRCLFRPLGSHTTEPVPFVQPVAAYAESFHARNGFSRDRMDPAAAAAFNRAVTEVVSPYSPDGVVRLEVAADIVWGEPAPEESGGPAGA
jgi:SAM-dependent methyltransferase